MRSIGLDVHRDFCEVAIAEGGALRSAGRIETTPAALRLFAESLGSEDSVALEATTQAAQVARLIEPHVARVVIANTRKLAAITQAKAKTDRLDARTLARLLASGYLEQVWAPDEETRSLRRLVARRSRLVRARTRAKNEVHGVLARNLCPRPPVTDAFGKAGRRWLSTLVLPDDEQLTLEGCLRQIDFLDEEVGAIERKLAERALQSVDIRRLMTVPGVNVQTAAAFVASVGDIGRFSSPRKLVSYLGLDPRVRQSGSEVARHGHISKAGSAAPHARRGRLEGDDDSRPVAGLLRARPLAPRSSGRGHGDRAQARGALLAPAHAGRGLCVRAPGDDPQEDPPARAARGCSAPQGQGRRRRQLRQPACARGRARALGPSRGRLSTLGQRLARERTEEEGCGRDTGTRIFSAVKAASRAAGSMSPNGLLFASSVTRTRPRSLTERDQSVEIT